MTAPELVPPPLEAFLLDEHGALIARCPVVGDGRLVFDLPPAGAPAIRVVRWTDRTGVTSDFPISQPIPVLDHPEHDGPRGECPECHRSLPLDQDADPPCSYFLPLHGGWPPCEGSGLTWRPLTEGDL